MDAQCPSVVNRKTVTDDSDSKPAASSATSSAQAAARATVRRHQRAQDRRKPKPYEIEVVRVRRFEELGQLPIDDPLAMNAWMHRALGVSASQVVQNPDMTEAERIDKLVDLAGKMAALTPQSRIHGAESLIRGDHSKLAGQNGPQMESATHATEATADDRTTGRPATRRGRPRKRGMG